jgi:hypothetical protein
MIMRKSMHFAVGFALLNGLICSCGIAEKDTSAVEQPSHVEVKSASGKYQLYVNGEPFTVKGVGMGGVGDGSRIRALRAREIEPDEVPVEIVAQVKGDLRFVTPLSPANTGFSLMFMMAKARSAMPIYLFM